MASHTRLGPITYDIASARLAPGVLCETRASAGRRRRTMAEAQALPETHHEHRYPKLRTDGVETRPRRHCSTRSRAASPQPRRRKQSGRRTRSRSQSRPDEVSHPNPAAWAVRLLAHCAAHPKGGLW